MTKNEYRIIRELLNKEMLFVLDCNHSLPSKENGEYLDELMRIKEKVRTAEVNCK